LRVELMMIELFRRYGVELRIVWRDQPLPFHSNALPAAMAAREAFVQGGNVKFWAMHERLFANQRDLERPALERYAAEIGLNMARFRSALDAGTHRAAIEADMALASRIGASGTPAFFVNGRVVRGAQPVEVFVEVIDAELAKARELVRLGVPRARVYEVAMMFGAERIAPEGVRGARAPAREEEDPNRVYSPTLAANAPSRGAANARVTVQIFSDFECPFCSRIEPTLSTLVERYGSRVRFVWRDYPLPFHQNAMLAAEAAQEVFAQLGNDGFWRFHDVLMENQRALTRPDLERYAGELGRVDMRRFLAALDGRIHRAAIEAQINSVRAAGMGIGTPSVLVNGRLIQGARPVEQFEEAIDRALAE
jgi:protein-disulfide isomerase